MHANIKKKKTQLRSWLSDCKTADTFTKDESFLLTLGYLFPGWSCIFLS